MAKRSTRLTGTYQLLLHVPKHAIVDYLLRDKAHIPAVERAVRRVYRFKGALTRAMLFTLSLSELAAVFQSFAPATEAEARSLHEEWRYRGMKSLYLFAATGKPPKVVNLIAGLNAELHAARGATPPGSLDTDLETESLEFRDLEQFPHLKSQLLELRYTYIGHVNVIDPNGEEPKAVEDLRSGFVWLHPSAGWLVICARDLSIRDRIAHVIPKASGLTLTALRFTKELVAQFENDTHVRRRALIDPKTSTSRRYTGRHLGQDDQAQREMSLRLQSDDSPFSGYDVAVDRDTQMVLSYNNRQGKVFFSRDLTVAQLRKWAPAKIDEIVQAVQEHSSTAPTFAAAIADPYLKSLLRPHRTPAAELAIAVAACKTNRASEWELSHDALHYLNTFRTSVTASVYPPVGDNGIPHELCCPSCQSEQIRLNSAADGLECRDCGSPLNLARVPTLDGPAVRIGNLADVIQLVPAPALTTAVVTAAGALSRTPCNVDEEFFVIRGRTVAYSSKTDATLLTVNEVPEVASLLERTVAPKLRQQVMDVLPKFKEKCRRMTTVHCQGCVAHRVGPNCFLRLFGLVDNGFTPKPHGGNEYGDYTRTMTADGRRNRQLVVAMKSEPKAAGEITSSSATGREILEQATRYMADPAKHVVGVSVPRDLHADFKSTLRRLASLHGKQLMLFDREVLARMVYTVMRRKRMKLNEI